MIMDPEGVPLDLAGLTVNERLNVTGILDQFDEAVGDGNRSLMVQLLTQVGLDEVSAMNTVTTILSEPTRYNRIRGH
jgi:hypothetical protein